MTGYSLRKAGAACARFRPGRRDEAGAGARGGGPGAEPRQGRGVRGCSTRVRGHRARPLSSGAHSGGFGSIRSLVTACRRRVEPLMLQFPPQSHAIPPHQMSPTHENVGIATTIFQWLKGCHGNCMRHFRETTQSGDAERPRSRTQKKRCTRLSAALHQLGSNTPVREHYTSSQLV